MSFRVYVAAPYSDAAHVRRVHGLLRYLRLEPTSSWAERPERPEELEALRIEDLRALAAQDEHDLASADAVLVITPNDAPRVMYAEAHFALERKTPVVWVGPSPRLAAYREGADLVDDMTEALTRLCELAAEHESGAITVRDLVAAGFAS